VSETVCKLARKGHTPSQIGVLLRDLHGIAQTKNVTGNKILRILKANGMLALAKLFLITFSILY
jgi:small subunit ribosomal protein S13e